MSALWVIGGNSLIIILVGVSPGLETELTVKIWKLLPLNFIKILAPGARASILSTKYGAAQKREMECLPPDQGSPIWLHVLAIKSSLVNLSVKVIPLFNGLLLMWLVAKEGVVTIVSAIKERVIIEINFIFWKKGNIYLLFAISKEITLLKIPNMQKSNRG